jgi:hypothetical protein
MLWGVVVLALVAGCTHSSSPHAATSPPSSGLSPHPSPTANPTASRLPTLTLIADQSEPSAVWDLILRVPFGSGRGELKYEPPSQSAPTEPAAFAVASDGTFWIVDGGNSRVAHFTRSGRFLDEVSTPGHYQEDIVRAEATMYVLLEEQAGLIGQVRSRGLRSITVNANGRALVIDSRLYPDSGGLVARAAGYSDSAGQLEGPAGFVRVNVADTGQTELLPGLPIGRGTVVNLESGRSDEEFDLVHTRDGVSVAQPVRFRLFVRGDSKRRRVPGVFGPDLLPLDGNVLMYVSVSPSRPGDQQQYGGSRWLLRMGRSPVLWERLPDPDIADEAQRRHIAPGPDGSIYLMLLTRTGASIYRRP